MFQSAWTRHRPTPQTYTPVVTEVKPEVIVPVVSVQPREESHQIMGKDVSPALEQATKNLLDAMEVRTLWTPAPVPELELMVTPEPIQETPVAPDIDVATWPVEVNLSPIIEEKFIDIDTHKVIAEFVTPPTTFDFTKVNSIHTYEEHVSDVNTTLQGIGNATTEDAYTYGINRLKNNKKPRPTDWIVGHIFGGTYDLWIHEYNEEDRTFFGFASFGGIGDQDAEWGYVSIDELLETKIPPIGHKLERDFYWTPCTLESLATSTEVAIQLGAEMDTPRIPWQVEHENHIMLAGWPWFARDEKWVWRETTDSSTYSHKFEEWDQQDIFFDTEAIRDTFLDEVNSISDDIYCPIENEIITFGDKVDKSTFNITVDEKYKNDRWTIYGIRFVSDSWKDGYTRDKADAFIKSHFASNKWDSLQQIKDRYSQWGGGGPAAKAGTFEDYEYDSKGCNVRFRGLQYCEDTSYSYTWKQVHDVLNTEVVQASLAIPEEHPRVAQIKEEVIKSEAPFKQEAELPPLKTYRKYEILPRPTERKDRIFGNLIEEHGENLTSLYQQFSWKGGLHEVEFKNCENFHEYTTLKQEFEMGQFFTPDHIAEKMVQLLRLPDSVKVIDITCGMGRFFNFIPNETRIYGCDNSWENLDVCKRLYPDAGKTGNFRHNDLSERAMWLHMATVAYNIGNPPFNIAFKGMWHHPLATQADEEQGGEGILLSQNAYMFHTTQYLMPGGVSFFIVPQTWLNGLRHTKIREYINENYYTVAELSLDDNAFSEYEVKFPTKALLLVKKGGESIFELEKYIGSFSDLDSFLKSKQYEWFIKAKKTIDQHFAAHKLKELRGNLKLDHEKRPYYDRLKKAIFETFRGLNMEDAKVLDKYKAEMDMMQVNYPSYQWEKLCRAQYTRLENALRRKEKNALTIEVIISRYDIIFRRSNNKVTEYFNQELNKLEVNGKLIWLPNKYTKNDLAVHDDIYSEFQQVMSRLVEWEFQITYKGDTRFISLKAQKWLGKYIEKIRKQYALNTSDTALLKDNFPVEYEENYEMLSEIEFPVMKNWENKIIRLLPHQLEDLSGALLKRNALISWDTGLGKTLGGITWSKHKGWKTLVIAPAVNTIDPWMQQLKEYRPDATVFLCKTKKDIFKYKWEDYLIVSFESFSIPGTVVVDGKKFREPEPFFETQLMKNRFRNLILDESDNAKNKSSKRFKSLRKVAKSFRNRLLMSGTPTRNNVNEIYNQIEILCQNSSSMICWATQQVEYDRSSREWTYGNNPNFGSPFPAWGGYNAFERTFSPKKITCFGAEETNQDIFNKDIFDKLMRSIRFTRDMEKESSRMNEAMGIEDFGIRKEYKQVPVPMSPTENKVYDYILTDLARQLEEMYSAQHDNQTASMLTIAQQIMKLLHGTSHPWTFQWFEDDEWVWQQVYDLDYNTSSKLEKACDIIDEVFAKPGINKIMIGSPWKPTELQMKVTLELKWYTVFNIRAEMSKHKRAEIVSQFRTFNGNAIILGTMGVLKSGLNLPEVNTVIAESYPWNFAQLHQFAARAIRLNSTEKTTVYCLTSEGSFDINVFSLILKKEVVNKFVRESIETSMEELSAEFGVESQDLFQQALQLVREKTNGRTKGTIKWWEKPVQESSSWESVITITHADKENFVKLAEMIGWADDSQIALMNSLMTKSKKDLLESLHSTDNPKFIGIINDTIRARFPE